MTIDKLHTLQKRLLKSTSSGLRVSLYCFFLYKTHTLITSVSFSPSHCPLFSQIFRGLEICCYGPFTNMPTGKRLGQLQSPAAAFPLHGGVLYRRVVLSGFLRLVRDYILCHLLDKTIPKCYPAEKKQPCAPSQELEGSEELTCRTQYVLWSDGVELLLPPFGLRKGENKKRESSALLKPLYLIQRRKLSSCISPVSLGPQSRGRLLNIF